MRSTALACAAVAALSLTACSGGSVSAPPSVAPSSSPTFPTGDAGFKQTLHQFYSGPVSDETAMSEAKDVCASLKKERSVRVVDDVLGSAKTTFKTSNKGAGIFVTVAVMSYCPQYKDDLSKLVKQSKYSKPSGSVTAQ